MRCSAPRKVTLARRVRRQVRPRNGLEQGGARPRARRRVPPGVQPPDLPGRWAIRSAAPSSRPGCARGASAGAPMPRSPQCARARWRGPRRLRTRRGAGAPGTTPAASHPPPRPRRGGCADGAVHALVVAAHHYREERGLAAENAANDLFVLQRCGLARGLDWKRPPTLVLDGYRRTRRGHHTAASSARCDRIRATSGTRPGPPSRSR